MKDVSRNMASFSTMCLALLFSSCTNTDYCPPTWKWNESKAGCLASILDPLNSDLEVETVPPLANINARTRRVDMRFRLKGRATFEFAGNDRTVFLTRDNSLFIAEFEPTVTGCSIIAVDLATARILWRTQLTGLGGVCHSVYLNKVLLEWDSGLIVVYGWESYGRYIEVLDPRTGAVRHHEIVERWK